MIVQSAQLNQRNVESKGVMTSGGKTIDPGPILRMDFSEISILC